MIGSFNKWDEETALIFSNEGNCFWSYTFDKIPKSFQYKFVRDDGGSTSIWEADPEREFNLQNLKELINKESSGKYQNCVYSFNKSLHLTTLICVWQ